MNKILLLSISLLSVIALNGMEQDTPPKKRKLSELTNDLINLDEFSKETETDLKAMCAFFKKQIKLNKKEQQSKNPTLKKLYSINQEINTYAMLLAQLPDSSEQIQSSVIKLNEITALYTNQIKILEALETLSQVPDSNANTQDALELLDGYPDTKRIILQKCMQCTKNEKKYFLQSMESEKEIENKADKDEIK